MNRHIESRRGGPAAEEAANNAPSATPAAPRTTRYHPASTRCVTLAPTAAEVKNVPLNIDGVWEVARETPKGEKGLAFDRAAERRGYYMATLLRVDGDTGALTGSWQDGAFVVSHFDGARPGLITLTPQADGSLECRTEHRQPERHRLNGLPCLKLPRAKGLPEPSNYQTHTTVRDPNEVFTFSFLDTKGKHRFQ